MSLRRASRLTTPSSPVAAKRKVQQKLQQQRNAKQHTLVPSPRAQIQQLTQPSIMAQKQQSGLRMPSSSRIVYSGVTCEPPRSQSAQRAPEAFAKSNRIPQTNQRSTLPRLSSKNSDARSSDGSCSSSGASSTRSTPMFGTNSPSMHKNLSTSSGSTCSGLQQPKFIPKPKTGLPTRSTANGEKRSLESLKMSRERSSDNLRMNREESAESSRGSRQASNENFRKISSSSVPCARSKQSTESLIAISRENTSEKLRRRNESTPCVNNNSIKPTLGLKKPQAITKSAPSLKKPSSGASTSQKASIPVTTNSESKLKAPESGLTKPSGLVKMSGISKPNANGQTGIAKPNSGIQKPGAVKTTGIVKPSSKPSSRPNASLSGPPKKTEPSLVPTITVDQNLSKNSSPASARKLRPPSTDAASRRASDGGVQMSTKSKLEVVQHKKKLSDLVKDPILETNSTITVHDERSGLKHPTVGKICDKMEASSTTRLKQPLQFKPSNSDRRNNNTTNNPIVSVQEKTTPADLIETRVSAVENTTVTQPDEQRSFVDIVEETDDLDCEKTIAKIENDPFSALDRSGNTSYDFTSPSPMSDGEEAVMTDTRHIDKRSEMVLSRKMSNATSSTGDEIDTCDGYAEPGNRIKRSDELSSDSGYVESMETLSVSLSGKLQLMAQLSNNSSVYPDESSSSNESNPSPNFADEQPSSSYYKRHSGDCVTNADDRNNNISSQLKRTQPVVLIPPPSLSSYDDDDDGILAIPQEYMRTPSSDIEEFQLIKHSPADAELRRRAREKAIKVWNGPKSIGEIHHDEEGEESPNEDEDEEEFLDVFFPSGQTEQNSNTLEKYAARTSIRRSSEEEQFSMEENMRQLETIAMDRKNSKKTSKLKKFFKKLSTKKDTKPATCDSGTVIHANGTILHANENHRNAGDYATEPDRLSSSSSGYDVKTRRRSDGTVSSVFSVNDMTTNTFVTPITKRRLFAINLSFMKRGRRQRCNTSVMNNSDNSNPSTSTSGPSETVRALCSPDMTRRNNFAAIAAGDRRSSEPSIYRLQHSSTSSAKLPPPVMSSKKYRAPAPTTLPTPPPVTYTLTPTPLTTLTTTTAISTMTTTSTPLTNITRRLPVLPRPSRGSGSSDGEEADYINYPFSKANVKPPQKPSRNGSKGSCSEPPRSNHNRSNSSGGGDGKSSSVHCVGVRKELRHTSATSDDSAMSSERYPTSVNGKSNDDVFDNNLTATNTPRSNNGSLRRTPLRHSIDSYNKLLEVHRQTIDKIASEVSRLVCNCAQLKDTSWNDYDRKSDIIQLGMDSYMVLPVGTSKAEQKSFTAWLRLDQQHMSCGDNRVCNENYSSMTLHRNCLHVCHIIEPKYAAPFEDNLPKSIEVNTAFISSQIPKMTLSKYIGMTIEKHTRYPEQYEKETALILLQVVKGVTHLLKKRVPLKAISSENIFLLNTGDSSVVLSPRKQSNKCPAVAVAFLPSLGDTCTANNSSDDMTNICHQLAFLLYELLHSPYEEELRLIMNSPILFTTLPDLTIKSIYSRYLQSVIDKLLGCTRHTLNSLHELMLTLEVVLFGPTNISDHTEREGVALIQKWHNRRCVDMVTHILKEAPLIMLCASEHCGQEVERIKSIDQEILLECEFLSTVLPVDVFKVSKELRR